MDLNTFRQEWSEQLQSGQRQASATKATSGSPDAKRCHVLELLCPPSPPPPKRPSKPQNELLKAFIDDLNELDEEDYFATVIPGEVASLVFRYLDLQTIGICCLVCRSWRDRICKDELLWQLLCKRMVPSDRRRLQGLRWRSYLYNYLLQERRSSAKWQQMLAAFYTLLPSATHEAGERELSCCFMSSNIVAAVLCDGSGLLHADPRHSPGELKRLGIDGLQHVSTVSATREVVCVGSAHGLAHVARLDMPLHQTIHVDRAIQSSLVHGDKIFIGHAEGVHMLAPSDSGWNYSWYAECGSTLALLPVSDACIATQTASNIKLLSFTGQETDVSGRLQTARVNHLSVSPDLAAYAFEEQPQRGAKVHAVETGDMILRLPTSRRVCSTMLHGYTDFFAGIERSGVKHYDLRSCCANDEDRGRWVKGQCDFNYNVSHIFRDDWKIVTVEECLFASSVTRHRICLADMRMCRSLWTVSANRPIRSCMMSRSKLVYSSAGPQCTATPLDATTPSFLNVLDFDAPIANVADHRCPFSSLYNNIHGWDANMELATPYSGIDPDRLG